MSLPRIDYPTFELTVPSTKQKIRYRPFLVKEEKILLTAQQSENANDIVTAMKQIISNCVLTENFTLDKLMFFDIQFIFLRLRANSVNNVVNLSYKDHEDGKVYPFEVDINTVEVQFDENHSNKIYLSDDMTLMLSYPGIDIPDKVLTSKNEDAAFFELIKSCLDKVYHGEELYDFKDASEQEKEDFLNNLSVMSFEKIKLFFQTMPKLKHELHYTNSLGHERKIVLDTLTDFFTLR